MISFKTGFVASTMVVALAFGGPSVQAKPLTPARPPAPLVLYTDFGNQDGAVSEVKGVAYGVSQKLIISDLSHLNPSDIFEGAYRLYQVVPYWPKGTVFVTVIDPGVGTARLSIALKTKAGHYFVGPDNGLITLIAEKEGIEQVRVIDETTNRLPGSGNSHTFYGRDVFGYTGARLAAGVISFEQVGPVVSADKLVRLPYKAATFTPDASGGKIDGLIPVLDVQYGNVWSDIPKDLFDKLNIQIGDKVKVRVFHGDQLVDEVTAPYQKTFGEVPVGEPLVYINSLLNVAVALNQGNYAAAHHIGSGRDWFIQVTKAK